MDMDKDIELKKLGERVREIREAKNLTQFELATRINKDQQSIQRLEKGKINPSYIYLLEVCKGLEVEMKDIL
jgi:transcriptional regulator with XRE-family HTH domain